MSESMIKVESVSKSFRDCMVLKNINIEFEKGKIHGLVGRNGSGKTVLLKCICGFMPVTSGKIIVNGKQIGKDVDIAQDVGIIIEAPGFLPNYSGYTNLRFLQSIQKKISKEEIRGVIRKVGLDPDSKKWVGKYSLGMRQRLGIAQAIMEHPSVLILDEPMNGLDHAGTDEIRNLLIRLKEEGHTILLATHSTEDVGMLCDTVNRMEAGILSTDSPNSESVSAN